MAKRNDFLTGFLQGLYQSGLGNPEVQRANEAATQERQAKINQNAAEQGLVPNTLPDNHPVRSKIGSFISSMFGGPSTPLQTAFKPDPQRPQFAMSPAGTTSVVPPGQPLPEGQFKFPGKPDEALGMIKSQNSRSGVATGISWDKATPEQQNLAKALYEGRILTSNLSFRDRGTTTALANEYAIKSGLPPFKAYRGDVAAGTAKNFAYGKFGQNVNSLNTALGHVGAVFDAYQALDNTDTRLLNTPINKLKEQTNDPAVIKLDVSLNALRGELATVFKGSSGTDQEIGSWKEFLDRDLTPTQAVGAMQQVDELLRSRQQALEYSRESGQAGGGMPLISPKASKTREKFGLLPGKSNKSSGGDPLGIR